MSANSLHSQSVSGNGRNLRICSRCLYDETVPVIDFDDDGVCNYCRIHDQMDAQYPAGEAGRPFLEDLVARAKRAGKGRKYDCIVGVSGGCDSSYLLYKMVDLGLHPLAVHFDNTWNSPIATQNIFNVTKALGVDLHTHVIDNREADDIYRAFLLSGVNELDIATDIAMVTVAYQMAAKYGVKYIMEGHSFRTEGVAPLKGAYMDGKYFESVHRQYGGRSLKTFPNLTLWRFLRWAGINGIRRVRPLYYMDYRKEEAKRFLAENLGWKWYGGHHLENRFTAFRHTYVASMQGDNTRVLGYAALVRSGQMTREEGLRLLAEPVAFDPEIAELVKKRLGLGDADLERATTQPRRHYTEFATYKRTFERLKWLFWVLYKLDRVPKSFYIKFCQKTIDEELRPVGRKAPRT